jgi:GNAT superfamily N-acetyltransferase
MQVRPFIAADYPDITRLHNQTYGDFAKYVDEIRYRDEHFPEPLRWARWIALDSDRQVVGFAEYRHIRDAYDPHRFGVDMAVDERAFGQGVRAHLYETVMDALASLEPKAVASWARADMPRLIRFLCERGFEPDAELFTSSLDLAGYHTERWLPRAEHLERQGIQVQTLESRGLSDESMLRELYDMWREVRGDLPLPPGETRGEPMAFDAYVEQLSGPGFLPAGYFVAVDGDRFVGTSQLWRSPIDGELRTGLTGVRRAYRRRGIAFGLKAHALSFAQQAGYARVVTDNAADNVGMLAINAALGFARNPVWTRYLKTF